MKFHNEVTNYLDSFPSADLRPVETAGGETWEEDTATVSSLHLGSESTPDRHGSFELVTTTSSIVSEQSEDSYATALEDAQPARLTSEEAAPYLKSLLKVGTNPTIGNFNNILTGEKVLLWSPMDHHGFP
jgi:hypothetical protein